MKTKTIKHVIELANKANSEINLNDLNNLNVHSYLVSLKSIMVHELIKKRNKETLKSKTCSFDYQKGYLDALKHAERLKNAQKSNLPYPCNVFHIIAKTAIELSEIKREMLDKVNRQNKVFEEMKAELEKINVNIKESVSFAKENRIFEENKNYKDAEKRYIDAIKETPIGKLSIECITDYIKKTIKRKY